MKTVVAGVFVAAALCLLCEVARGHIHSQKIKHIERDKLTAGTWINALISSALVGACGIFPLIINKWVQLDSNCEDRLVFKGVLSFAVGGLLGDVFLHLLPEAWGSREGDGMGIGLWVLAGLLSFMFIEKLVKITETELGSEYDTKSTGDSLSQNGMCVHALEHSQKLYQPTSYKQNVLLHNGVRLSQHETNKLDISNRTTHDVSKLKRRCLPGNQCNTHCYCKTGNDPATSDSHTHKHFNHTQNTLHMHSQPPNSNWRNKDISGYLNLIANCTDNFTHGLAIAASYVASPAVGVLTTLAILCHEIPHEIGDFAILLKSGFSLKEAAKAQMFTACGGLIGVVAGLTAEHLSSASNWLLPFTAGGFLYIALVSIVPDLLQDSSAWHSLVEVCALGVGIIIMALVTIIEKKSCGHMPASYSLGS